jgi:hemerythrin-like domain-containing protein
MGNMAKAVSAHGGSMFEDERRAFLKKTGLVIASGAAASMLMSGSVFGQAKQSEEKEDVSPIEDLGREHGLLNRVLLIYDEANRRLGAGQQFDVKHVADAAGIIKNFIENYHEKLEEEQLFPRFEKAHKLTDLVAVLREQHKAGRGVTAQILQLTASGVVKAPADRQKLEGALTAFNRMYRPHEAREDTVLFPAFRELVSEHEYDALGEAFEKKEHELFGKEGFEGMLTKVEGIEKSMGIYELGQFTPKV